MVLRRVWRVTQNKGIRVNWSKLFFKSRIKNPSLPIFRRGLFASLK